MITPRWFIWSPLLLIVVLLACEASGWFFLRAPAEALLTSRLGREVRIKAPFQLHFRSAIRLELGGLWIAAPSGFPDPHLVDAERLTLHLRYADLLALRRPTEPLRFATLAAERLDARLIRLADGRASWQFGGDAQRPPPTVDLLALQHGGIVLRDAILAADLDIQMSARKINGSVLTVAEIAGRLRDRPLRATITLPAGLSDALPRAGSKPVTAEGKVDYAGLHIDFSGLIGVGDFRGTAAVRGPSLSVLGRLFNTTLPTTAPFSLQAKVVKNSPVWQIAVTKARVGKSDLAGDFTYDARSQPPRLDGELTGQNFVLADLAPAFGTRNADGEIVRPSRGRTLPDRPLNLPSLARMNARVAINLDKVDLGSAFRQPIAPLRANLTLDGGLLTLSDINANTAQGNLAGTLAINARQPRAEWRADLAWKGIRLENWLKASKSSADDIRRQTSDNPPSWFTGSLHGRAQLVGHGRSTAELLASLDGRMNTSVRNGSVSHLAMEAMGLDVAQALGLLLKGDDRQPVECAIVDLEAKNGQITPRIALIATPVTVLHIHGSISLAQEQLDLRLVAKPQNFSPFTLRSPLRVHGAFADPQLTPEAAPIVGRALGALALALINPLAAILPFIDLGESDRKSCEQLLLGYRGGKPSSPQPSRPAADPVTPRDDNTNAAVK